MALFYLAAGAAVVLVLVVLARWFATASVSDLAQAIRTFVAVFAMLASTGLIFLGRFGLAAITLAATVMAVRSLVKARGGADPLRGGNPPGQRSRVETELLAMELDHATGELEGRVKKGVFAGRGLATLAMAELLALLHEAQREEPSSVALLETYLDRRFPDWRQDARGGTAGGDSAPAAATAPMDERTALAILGLAPGADEAEIKAAHRRLMAKLHPDHGGSDFLASQINRARDFLLGRRGA